jgi:hypothetical protein
VLGKALEFGAGGERGGTQAVLRQAFGDHLPLECLVFDQNDLRRDVQAEILFCLLVLPNAAR